MNHLSFWKKERRTLTNNIPFTRLRFDYLANFFSMK